MKIKAIRARALDAGFQNQALQASRVASPMSRWPRFAARRSSWMWPTKKVIAAVETDEGAVGWSCTNGGEVTAMIVEQHLARLLAEQDIGGISDLWDQMCFSLLPNDRSGFAMMAIAAVDIALWDLKAKLSGQALVDLLGGSQRDELHAYATTDEPERVAQERWWGLKAAMPYGPELGKEGLEQNIALMKRFRAAAGAGKRIMIDAFMAWTADYTLQFIDASRDLDLFWIEDPLPPYDLDGLRKLREHAGSALKLALGNFCFNRWDSDRLMDEALVDVLQPDVAWAGGITESLRILKRAKSANVPVILHNTCEQPWALALAAARQVIPVVEFVDRGQNSRLYDLMGPRPGCKGGKVEIPRSPLGNTPPQYVRDCFAE